LCVFYLRELPFRYGKGATPMTDTNEAGRPLKEVAAQMALSVADCDDCGATLCGRTMEIRGAIIEGMKAALERAKSNRTADCVNCQGADIWIDKEIEALK
jgi:hypothetical protein